MHAKPTDRIGVVEIGGLGHLALKFAAKFDIHTATPENSKKRDSVVESGGNRHLLCQRAMPGCAIDALASENDTAGIELPIRKSDVKAFKKKGRGFAASL
jgi:D-arabinose 1-dehydrogenase-like Zn-dependent alcohol dehydrogenase